MIRLEQVTRLYETGGDTVHALAGVDLAIGAGEFVAIMGQSGSGKSTLMHILGCLDRPTSGRYLFEGHDVGRLSDDALSRLRSEQFGFVFQSYNLLPRLPAIEQVELPLLYQRATKRREGAAQALATVGLGDRMHHRPTELSGGQQQRVAIARSLVVSPRVLMADEPTGALDTTTGEEIMAVLAGLVRDRGITVLLVTHEPSIAAHAERLIRLRDGRVIEDGHAAAAQ